MAFEGPAALLVLSDLEVQYRDVLLEHLLHRRSCLDFQVGRQDRALHWFQQLQKKFQPELNHYNMRLGPKSLGLKTMLWLVQLAKFTVLHDVLLCHALPGWLMAWQWNSPPTYPSQNLR